MPNLALLTKSHNAIAAKKKEKRYRINEVVFDDNARKEFLTGFHKRKLAKTEASRTKALEREKQQRLEARREQRRLLRERAIENAAEVESAYHALLGNPNEDSEWVGIPAEDKGKQKKEEYEGEEILATVAVVEDLDLASFTHSMPISVNSTNPPDKPKPTISQPPIRGHAPSKAKGKKARYGTKQDRKLEHRKQRARRTEKAELAGGKASRRRGFATKKEGRKWKR